MERNERVYSKSRKPGFSLILSPFPCLRCEELVDWNGFSLLILCSISRTIERSIISPNGDPGVREVVLPSVRDEVHEQSEFHLHRNGSYPSTNSETKILQAIN